MAVVIFDYSAWALRYPTLAVTVGEPVAQDYFYAATGFLDNTDTSPVQDVDRRAMLLGLVVAHLAILMQRDLTAVGRITDATEGSVSVKFESALPKGPLAAYFAQTQPGATFWALTARFRRARYIPPPARCAW